MEEDEAQKSANSFPDSLTSVIEGISLQWQRNITIIDLSDRNITDLDQHVKLPGNLVELNLSHNKLTEVPNVVMNLENLKSLDVSYNSIKFFDDSPNFRYTLERLNISHNDLNGPPFWVWFETKNIIKHLDLSCNKDITTTLKDEYYDWIVDFMTSITVLDVHNCTLKGHVQIMSTFPKVRTLILGSTDLNFKAANRLLQLPCSGLDQCHDIERLYASNTYIYNINFNIDAYKNLIEIDLSFNILNGLPNEFCNLANLEICLLSSNKLTHLPEDFHKLDKLRNLYLDSNELCMLPERFSELQNLTILDLYDNCLREFPEDMGNIEELDLAQNYFDEPEDEQYIAKKEKLRLVKESRKNERKIEVIISESELSDINTDTYTDDEDSVEDESCSDNIGPVIQPSTPDWDSDDYWMPNPQPPSQPAMSPWLNFVQQKMDEGNFYPMDVVATVEYEKWCNPQELHESDGQFDDYSSDDN